MKLRGRYSHIQLDLICFKSHVWFILDSYCTRFIQRKIQNLFYLLGMGFANQNANILTIIQWFSNGNKQRKIALIQIVNTQTQIQMIKLKKIIEFSEYKFKTRIKIENGKPI